VGKVLNGDDPGMLLQKSVAAPGQAGEKGIASTMRELDWFENIGAFIGTDLHGKAVQLSNTAWSQRYDSGVALHPPIDRWKTVCYLLASALGLSGSTASGPTSGKEAKKKAWNLAKGYAPVNGLRIYHEMQGAASPEYRDHANGFYWLTATLRQSQPHAHESYVQSDTNRGG
jgi:hypothetical protein